MLSTIGAGVSAAQNGALNSNFMYQQMQGAAAYPTSDKMHTFTCEQVENGWTLTYRGKSYIAADIDSLMEQMRAAMVAERIEK